MSHTGSANGKAGTKREMLEENSCLMCAKSLMDWEKKKKKNLNFEVASPAAATVELI